jgi:hypothetical protein
MSMRMKATPLGSAVPTLTTQDHSMKIATNHKSALLELKQTAERLRAADSVDLRSWELIPAKKVSTRSA